jgi:hypothetical protein
MIDAKAFGAEVAGVVKEHVGQALAPLAADNAALRGEVSALTARLAEVEARPVHDLTEIKDAIAAIKIPEMPELPDVEAMIAEAMLKGEKGDRGDAGTGITDALISREGHLVLTLSDGRSLNVGPVVGQDGRDGAPGEKGADGINGRDGAPGRDGADGLDGKDGAPGRDGADGLDGKDGRDGADGLGFDDMSVEYDGERLLTLSWAKGDIRKETPIRLNVPLYRGTFSSGVDYEKGDCVTWGGSVWIAQVDAPEGNPSEGAKGWRLAVKRGRNAKEPVPK